MPCYRPVTAWKPLEGGAIVFSEKKNCREVKVRCSQCIGCRLDLREAWALRNYCEGKMHSHSWFMTMTYDEEHLPLNGSLVPDHSSDFVRALRRPTRLGRLRYFVVGEYGEQYSRPHYHALIYGPEISDLCKVNSIYAKSDVFSSEVVQAAWPHGMVVIGRSSLSAARYVSGYVTKKYKGRYADDFYTRVVDETGEIVRLEAEFSRMSRRPGIGLPWLEKYWGDIYRTGHDAVVVNGQRCPVPRYFYDKMDALLGATSVFMDDVDFRRWKRAESHADECTPERLAVREQVELARINFNAER